MATSRTTRRRLSATLTLALTVALVAACGSGDDTAHTDAAATADTTVTTAGAPATTETLAPSTTTTSPIDHAQTYLDLVTPSNCALVAIRAIEEQLWADDQLDDEEWPTVRDQLLPAYATYADELIEFSEGLIAHPWPDDVVDDAHTLAAELNTVAAWDLRVAQSATLDDFYSRVNEPFPEDRGLAGVVRAKLGLESNLRFDPATCHLT